MNNGDPLYERKTFSVPSNGPCNPQMCAEKGHGWVDERTGVCRTCCKSVDVDDYEGEFGDNPAGLGAND